MKSTIIDEVGDVVLEGEGTVRDLLERAARSRKEIVEATFFKLPDEVFRGAKLDGLTFDNCHFDHIDFRNSSCCGVTFKGCDFDKVSFGGTDFTGAVFDCCSMTEEVEFDDAVFDNTRATLGDTMFRIERVIE